jgi:hypothetical protein
MAQINPSSIAVVQWPNNGMTSMPLPFSNLPRGTPPLTPLPIPPGGLPGTRVSAVDVSQIPLMYLLAAGFTVMGGGAGPGFGGDLSTVHPLAPVAS